MCVELKNSQSNRVTGEDISKQDLGFSRASAVSELPQPSWHHLHDAPSVKPLPSVRSLRYLLVRLSLTDVPTCFWCLNRSFWQSVSFSTSSTEHRFSSFILNLSIPFDAAWDVSCVLLCSSIFSSLCVPLVIGLLFTLRLPSVLRCENLRLKFPLRNLWRRLIRLFQCLTSCPILAREPIKFLFQH